MADGLENEERDRKMKTFYVTRDTDTDGYIEFDAEIRRFETEETALEYLLDGHDPDEFDFSSARLVRGEFSDCWIKFHEPVTEDHHATAPFRLDEVSVSGPGSHPGGKAWWVTPYADVMVLRVDAFEELEAA